MPAATDFKPSLTIDRARTVAVVVPSQLRHWCGILDELCAHVFKSAREFNLLGNGNAILRDARRTKGFVEDHVVALGAKCDALQRSQLV